MPSSSPISRETDIIHYSRFLNFLVFTLPLVFFPFANQKFELAKISLFRITVAVWVIFFLITFFRKGIIIPIIEKRKKFYQFLFLIIAFSLCLIFATFFSISPWVSFYGSLSRHQGLWSLVHFLVFGVFIFLLPLDSSQISKILRHSIYASFLVSIFGILQKFDFDLLFFGWDKSPFLGRSFSTLGHPNFLGSYLLFQIPITFLFFCLASEKRQKPFFEFLDKKRRANSKKRQGNLLPLDSKKKANANCSQLNFPTQNIKFSSSPIYLLILLTQLICLLLTANRGAWLGLLGGAMFLLFFYLYEKKREGISAQLMQKKHFLCTFFSFLGIKPSTPEEKSEKSLSLVSPKKSLLKKIFSLLLLGIFLGATFYLTSSRLRHSYRNLRSVSLRFELYAQSLKAISDRPIGYGLETFHFAFSPYMTAALLGKEDINKVPDRAHNEIIDLAFAAGVLAPLIYYLIFAFLLKEFWFSKAPQQENSPNLRSLTPHTSSAKIDNIPISPTRTSSSLKANLLKNKKAYSVTEPKNLKERKWFLAFLISS